MTTTYLVTGANKGIGLGLVKKITSSGDNFVIATARDVEKATDLKKLADDTKKVKIIQLDVADAASIDSLDEGLKGVEKIDVYIANAGVSKSYDPVLVAGAEAYFEHSKVNTVGPILVLQKLHKYMQSSSVKKLVFISSSAGSINDCTPFPTAVYGASKAALNYIVKKMSFELSPEGYNSVSINPGIVDTDLTFQAFEVARKALNDPNFAPPTITTEESASGIFDVIQKPGSEINGAFIDYTGVKLAY